MFIGSRLVRGIATAGIVLLALASCGSPPRPARTINQARVPVVAAVRGTVTPRSSLGGLIVPLQNVQIQNTLSEPAIAVNVAEGDRVTKGQVLAQLDTADLRAQLQSYMGSVASDAAKAQASYLNAGLIVNQNSNSINAAQAALRQSQATLANDQGNLQRDTQLAAQGYISQQAFDQQRTVVNNDVQAVNSARVALQNLQSQVTTNGTTTSGLQGANVAAARADQQTAMGLANQVRAQIAKATIVSPIDGVVVNRNLNLGEYPGTRQIFTLQELDSVYAVLNGSGSQIIGVRTGSRVPIVSSDRATVRGTARVTAVLDQLTPGSTNFVIKALLPNPGLQFRPGMVVVGNVSRPTAAGIRIPRTAFVDDTQSSVQTIDNGAVKTIPVTMVVEDGKNAVVQGLRAGEKVIANGQLGLSDGQPVQPLDRTRKTVAER